MMAASNAARASSGSSSSVQGVQQARRTEECAVLHRDAADAVSQCAAAALCEGEALLARVQQAQGLPAAIAAARAGVLRSLSQARTVVERLKDDAAPASGGVMYGAGSIRRDGAGRPA
jgi:hypothetical protein